MVGLVLLNEFSELIVSVSQELAEKEKEKKKYETKVSKTIKTIETAETIKCKYKIQGSRENLAIKNLGFLKPLPPCSYFY